MELGSWGGVRPWPDSAGKGYEKRANVPLNYRRLRSLVFYIYTDRGVRCGVRCVCVRAE